MTDALVSIALEKLTDVLEKQLALFADVSGELEKLKNTFQSIQAVLADAESRQIAEKSVHLWLSRLRDVAYDIENVLNDWLINGLEKDGRGDDEDDDTGNRARATVCLPSPYACLDLTVSRGRVALDIKEIRERLDQIAKDKDQFNTSQISSFGGDRRRPVRSRTLTSSYMEEEMIGRDDDRDTVISRLVSGSSSNDGQVQVITIVGVGGLGKTTLARKIYHDDKVQNHFQKFPWVCVSEDFDVKRLTKAMIEQVKGASSSFSELNSLQNELLEALRGRRFLLVLDDVWNDDKNKWKRLWPSLTSGAPGSRILVTTRLQKVAADTMNSAYIHPLKGLSDDHSWTIFSSIAFYGKEAEECSQLESVGREIARKCKGVPLSITVMGSVMNSKTTVEDWQNILYSQMWSLPEAEDKILPALWLSYHNLPPHLKQCFVYCSIYEKDNDMYKDELIKLWIAQGLVQSQGNREREDVGTEYFEDLVAWSMFQEVGEDEKGKITCKMHDLLHDLTQFITKDETYTYTGENSNQCPINVRHASFILNEDNLDIPVASHGGKKLRTLFLDGAYGFDVVHSNLFHQARFLRTLFLNRLEIKILPKNIGKLKHLRYLKLSGSSIVELPNAVGKLKHLRYLYLSKTRLMELPNAIGKLKHLRYLDLSGTRLMELPNAIGKLKHLRYLDLSWTRLMELPNAIGKLTHLKHLNLANTGIVELPESMSHLCNLHNLNLNSCYQLKRLPKGMGGMMSLRYLGIEYTECLEYLPSGMGRISSLRSLSKFIVGDEGGCRIDELQQLKSLQGDMEIIYLERVSSCEESRRAELCNKPHLHKLVLKMSERDQENVMSESDADIERKDSDANLEQQELVMSRRDAEIERTDSVIEGLQPHANLEQEIVMSGRDAEIGRMNNVLEGLRPHVNLQELELYCGMRCSKLPSWMGDSSLSMLTTLKIQGLVDCEQNLPGLGKLPKLKYLDICRVGVRKMGHELYYGNNGNGAAGGRAIAFPMLEQLSLQDMLELEEWGLTSDADVDVMPCLRFLKLSGCQKLEGLPHHLAKAPLKELEISSCPIIKGTGCSYFPLLEEFRLIDSDDFLSAGLTNLPNLKKFQIHGLRNVTFPNGGWEQLATLQELKIQRCEGLKSLPDGLTQLQLLEKLDVAGCKVLDLLPQGLGQLKKLKSLDIGDAETLTHLPDSLGQLESLEHLDIRDAKKLESLPDGFGELKKLKHLEISSAEAMACLPDSLGQLESLEELHIGGLKILQSLPEGLGQLNKLQSLKIQGVEALVSLPDSLENLEKLESLEISGAEALVCMPDSLGRLKSLESLFISGLKRLQSLPEGLGRLEKLRRLHIHDMEGLTCLPAESPAWVESLVSLRLHSCKKLESLPHWLGQLKRLWYLEITHMEGLTCLPESPGQLQSLYRLKISDCKKLKSLPLGVGMGQLKSLELGYLEAFTRLPRSLAQIKSLEYLKISEWVGLESLPRWFRRLKSLKRLTISDCPALRSLPRGLGDLPRLTALWIFRCPLLSDRCKREGSEEWHKYSCIPVVFVDGLLI